VTEFQAAGLAETFLETQAAIIAEGLGGKLSPSITGTKVSCSAFAPGPFSQRSESGLMLPFSATHILVEHTTSSLEGLALGCKVVVDKSVCGLGGGRFGHDRQPWRVASLMSL
jgi:hypothetical protein